MDLTGSITLTALVLLTNAWASTTANAAQKTTNRVVEIALPGTLNLASFYRSKPRSQHSDTAYDSAWGIKLNSFVPIDGLTTSLDYSLAATGTTNSTPTAKRRNPAEQGFLADRNHFLVLKLATKWHDVQYGLRYFSIGEAFASDPLGRDLIAQSGIARGASGSDGTEVWATLKLPVIKLRPIAKRTVREVAGTQRTENQLGLTAERMLYGKTRIVYRYNSTSSVAERGDESSAHPNRQVAQISVRLKHPEWQIVWKSKQAEFSYDHSALREESLQEISGTFQLSDELTFSPSISRRQTRAGAQGISEHARASIKLAYVSAVPRLPNLNLAIRYDETEGLQLSNKRLQANLGFRKTLDFHGVHRARTSVGASLTYRRNQDDLTGRVDNDLGFRLTFEHTIDQTSDG